MSHLARQVIIAGNWKMYKGIEEAISFISDLAPLVKESTALVYLAVPYTAIKAAADQAKESKIVVGAQNMNDASCGAFTGEISGKMLKEAGAKFVILGHSERRNIFKETDQFINKKMHRALSDGLQPVLCVGELLEDRENGRTEEVLKTQISECLAGLDATQLLNVVLAYEPTWAIGTNRTATPEIAQLAHEFCRQFIASTWGEPVAEKLSILYGGSVKPENAKTLMDQLDIDGLLIGGASLSVDSFSKIVNYS